MGYLPRVGQRSVVADDSHRESRRDAVEIPGLNPFMRLCPSYGDRETLQLSHSDRVQRLALQVWRIPMHSPIDGHDDVRALLHHPEQRANSLFQILGHNIISCALTWVLNT